MPEKNLRSLPILVALILLLPANAVVAAHPGQAIYQRACAHCHGSEGEGWPAKNGPTLRNTDWVVGDQDRLIKITLGGLYLRIPLGYGTHYGAMVGVKDSLGDSETADLLSYLRTAWGNQAGPVSIERVAKLRPEISSRKLPYTAADFGLSAQPRLGPNGEALEPPDPFAAAGFKIYQTTCMNCHQATGLGIVTPDGHGYPPLAGSEFVTGSPTRLVRIVLGGLQGPVEVKGKIFTEVMPPWHAALTDEQIAQILTFIRQSWANLTPPVSPSQVRELRSESEKREGLPWTQAELDLLERKERPQ